MMTHHLKIALKIGISAVFIGYLSLRVDFADLAGSLRQVDLFLYIVSTGFVVLANFIVAGKYYLLIKGSSIERSVLFLAKINFITRFYELFLPAAAGQAVRWIKVTRNQNGRGFFLAAIIFERLTFLVVLILCGTIPLFLYKSMPEITVLKTRLMPWILLGLGIIVVLFSFYLFAPLRSFFKSFAGRIFAPLRGKVDIAALIDNFSFKHMGASFYVYLFGLSIVWQIFFIGRLFTLILAASLPLNWVDITWIGSFVLLLQSLPISFAGIGLREGAYAYLFSLFQLPPENGILIGILFFSQMLMMALVGVVLEWTDR
jgi:uncharacterized membrane protein YbhN (UPF0104 family)